MISVHRKKQQEHKLLEPVVNCTHVEPAMWLFVTTEGVEPTNNAYRLEQFVLP